MLQVIGNVAPVYSLEGCMVACESAPGCSALAWAPQDRACFLKGCPSNHTVQCPVSLHCCHALHALQSMPMLCSVQ